MVYGADNLVKRVTYLYEECSNIDEAISSRKSNGLKILYKQTALLVQYSSWSMFSHSDSNSTMTNDSSWKIEEIIFLSLKMS